MNEERNTWNGYAVIGDTKELDKIVEYNGYINLDNNDILSTLSQTGNNYVASGSGDSLGAAFKSAMDNIPVSVDKIKRMLAQYVCGDNTHCTTDELLPISEMLKDAPSDMNMKWGLTLDQSMKDYKVIIVLSE